MKARPHRLLALLAIAAVLLCAPFRAGGSERYLFRQIDSTDGLPDNNVRNMLMLPNGLMCIQTATMLNLYDGAACQSYAFNPIRIPYQEYSGLTHLYYDAGHRLWLSNRDHTWRFDLSRREFEYDTQQLFAPFDPGQTRIESFFLAPAGDYWVLTGDGRLRHCDPQTGRSEAVDKPEALRSPLIMAASGPHVWMLSLDGTLARYDTKTRSFTGLYRGIVSDVSSLSSRMEMVALQNGDLWMLFDRDLVRYSASTGRTERIGTVPLGRDDVYTSIAADRSGSLWIGSAKSGVSILDAATLEVRNLPWIELTDGKRIDHNTDISKIYVDPHDGVWIATLTEGVFYWHKDIFRLRTVNNATLPEGRMTDQSVKCLVEEPDGRILLGTIKGLLRYDPSTGRITVPYPELRDELCISLYRDRRDRIWLGTFHHGACCIDRGHIRRYFHRSMPPVDVSYHEATPNLNCVRAFHEDRDGRFWICVYGGLGRFDPASGAITLLRDRHPKLNRFMLTRGVCEVADGLLVTSDNGLYRYDPATDRVSFDPQDAQMHVPCNQALTDPRGLVWLASSDGLHVTDADGTHYRLTTREGLPNDNILGLACDLLGNVWAATFNHLSRIKPIREGGGNRLTFAVASYGAADGMTAGALFQNALTVGADGRLYAGGARGFSVVDPSALYQQNYNVTPVISSLRIFDRPVEVGAQYGGRCILPRELSQTRHIDLRHDETFLTFGFSNLNYTNPSHTVYRYKLENFDKEWTEVHARGTGQATYTLLEPGDYVFRVMAADNDTDWSDRCAEIAFTIHPPFWKSSAALAVYALVALLTVMLGVRYAIRRLRRRTAQRRREELLRQKEEMDQMKFRFFTNISHELRTPLSLIILPLESIIRRTGDDSPFRPQLLTIHRHATQLLSLVNHLLDFRKIEMHGERLNLSRGDIAGFVEGLVDTFGDAAREKEIDLAFDNRMTNSYMAFDPTQMYKIVSNLLSNALKFTPKGGSVVVRLLQPRPETMQLRVTDTGIGISEKDRAHIFERFYQSGSSSQPQGSGIGLCLVEQYARMHGGHVEVESEVGRGSTFCVEIPTTLRAPNAAEPHPEAERDPETGADGQERCRLLLVEDNPDFRAYVAGELSAEFEVLEAENGEEGLRKAHKHRPNVVVCDVMMPRMDGFEVCRRLKNDIETSHIPIILLTARADDDVRREGYEAGADGYISKPFNMEVLLARIRNLIEEHRRRIRSFTSEADISPSQITVTTLDRRLIDRIMEHVERNIGNPNYSVEELSSDVAMHRMNLYRKLQSITGMTPSEFLRTMRLKRAAQLLAQDDGLSVTEVSEMVGFNTPKYFTRYFREMFGCTPSQYAAQRKQEGAPASEDEAAAG